MPTTPPRSHASATIHVHIERLVVDGLDLGPSAADDVRVALEERLTELLTERPSLGELGERALTALHGRSMLVTRGMRGPDVGATAADALHAGFVGVAADAREHGGTARE